MSDGPLSLAGRVVDGDVTAVARVLTLVERGHPDVEGVMRELYRVSRDAHVIGITGPAGSGKSTLTTCLAVHYVDHGRRVGIIAVDPSSVFTGGAILGDRIRMGALSGNEGVFIRSMAARGALGGLSRAVSDAVAVLSAAGYEVVIVETLGVGQAEVDVITVAETVLVVSVPGLGDSVQALKAGLLEIADIHVVNKSDREGAHQTAGELKEMLRLARRRPHQWNVPVLMTAASTGSGIPELVDEMAHHRAWLVKDGSVEVHRRRNAETRLDQAVQDAVRRRLVERGPDVATSLDRILVRGSDPITEADHLLDLICEGSIHAPSDR